MLSFFSKFAFRTLLGSPWFWLAAFVLATTMFGGTYLIGRSDGAARCNASWLLKEAARVHAENDAVEKRDARVNSAQDEDRKRASDRIAQDEANQVQVDKYESTQAARQDDDCSISDDDARSLRNIR